MKRILGSATSSATSTKAPKMAEIELPLPPPPFCKSLILLDRHLFSATPPPFCKSLKNNDRHLRLCFPPYPPTLWPPEGAHRVLEDNKPNLTVGAGDDMPDRSARVNIIIGMARSKRVGQIGGGIDVDPHVYRRVEK